MTSKTRLLIISRPSILINRLSGSVPQMETSDISYSQVNNFDILPYEQALKFIRI